MVEEKEGEIGGLLSISDELRAKEILLLFRTAVSEQVRVVLTLWEADPHQFSTRPCSTCKAVTAIAGRPFGCVKKAMEKP